MAFLADTVLDGGLDYLTANGTRIDICSTEPTTYTEATSTFTEGNKTALSVGAAEDGDASGRKVVVPAITDGDVTGTDTVTHWALTDATSELLAVNTLSSSQVVTSGNTFTLAAFDITIPDPA
jgi:hypothetical protein